MIGVDKNSSFYKEAETWSNEKLLEELQKRTNHIQDQGVVSTLIEVAFERMTKLGMDLETAVEQAKPAEDPYDFRTPREKGDKTERYTFSEAFQLKFPNMSMPTNVKQTDKKCKCGAPILCGYWNIGYTDFYPTFGHCCQNPDCDFKEIHQDHIHEPIGTEEEGTSEEVMCPFCRRNPTRGNL